MRSKVRSGSSTTTSLLVAMKSVSLRKGSPPAPICSGVSTSRVYSQVRFSGWGPGGSVGGIGHLLGGGRQGQRQGKAVAAQTARDLAHAGGPGLGRHVDHVAEGPGA